MDFGLFLIYITSIAVLSLIILILNVKWGDFFPHKWIILITIIFLTLIFGIICLFISELTAPSNYYFYLNPFLYSMFFALIGCTYFAVYLLVFEIHFKHIRSLQFIGWVIFITILSLIAINAILFLTTQPTSYPWISYLVFEVIFCLGMFAYLLLAIGSFKDSSSERLEQKYRIGLILVGIFSIGITIGIGLVALVIFFALPYAAFPMPPQVTAFWLIWICFVDIIFLFMVRGAVKPIT